MFLNMECEFRDRGSNPSECQRSRDVDLGQVNFLFFLIFLNANFHDSNFRNSIQFYRDRLDGYRGN